MPKKKDKQEEATDSVFIIAAKTIGKAAGKIASVIGGVAVTKATSNEQPKPAKRSAKKKASKPANRSKKGVATPAEKGVRKRRSK